VGGLNTSRHWTGNQQMVAWMWYNQDKWEFRSFDQLQPGDFVFYGYDQYNGNASNWSDTDPTMTGNGYQSGPSVNFAGWSRFAHVALVVGQNRIAAWNAEYWNVPLTGWYSMPARLGVHIKDSGGSSNPPNYADQGELLWGQTHYNVSLSSTTHRWHYWLPGGTGNYLIDIQPTGGSPLYDMRLTDGSGNVVANGQAPSASDGRGILAFNSGAGDYYLYLIPRAGANGTYNIAIWNNSIPRIDFAWGWQSSYSNILHWQAYLGSNTSFNIPVQRIAGSLEYDYVLQNRSDGSTLTSGHSLNGNAMMVSQAGPGWLDFYMSPTGGTDGSYRIGIYSGVPSPGVPTILAPAANSAVNTSFNVVLQPGAGNGRGVPDYHVQIASDANFTTLVYDNSANWSLNTTIALSLPLGNYYMRAQQGDHISMASGWSPTTAFTVSVPKAPTSAPILLQPATGAAVNTVTPTLSWQPVINALTYHVQVAANSTFTNLLQDVEVVNALFFTTQGLNEGTYYWRVQAYNDSIQRNAGPWSVVRSFTVDITGPSGAPVLISPTPNATSSTDRPLFRWLPVSGATLYEIQLDTSLSFAVPTSFIGTALSYTPPGPLLPTTYYWRVRGRDKAGNVGLWSDVYGVVINPSASAALVLNVYTTRSPALTWLARSGVSSYEVVISNSPSFINPIFTASPTTATVTPPPLPNGVWYWRVRAKLANNTWGPAATGSFVISAP
jgi:hypothetical protein